MKLKYINKIYNKNRLDQNYSQKMPKFKMINIKKICFNKIQIMNSEKINLIMKYKIIIKKDNR